MNKISSRVCFSDIEDILSKAAYEESIRLWRLARKAESHGCSHELVTDIREEGWEINKLSDYGYCYRLLMPDRYFKYAFNGDRFGKTFAINVVNRNALDSFLGSWNYATYVGKGA